MARRRQTWLNYYAIDLIKRRRAGEDVDHYTTTQKVLFWGGILSVFLGIAIPYDVLFLIGLLSVCVCAVLVIWF